MDIEELDMEAKLQDLLLAPEVIAFKKKFRKDNAEFIGID